jgi:hypothetical protein
MVKALCYKPGSLQVSVQMWLLNVVQFILILSTALCPGIYSASNINEYQRQKKCFWGVELGLCVGLTILPPFMSRLSRKCTILNISQPYRPPRPVTGIALLFMSRLSRQCGILNISQPYRPPRPVTGMRLTQFFVAAVTCLPSRCLATIGEHPYKQTDERDLWSTLIWAQVPWDSSKFNVFRSS